MRNLIGRSLDKVAYNVNTYQLLNIFTRRQGNRNVSLTPIAQFCQSKSFYSCFILNRPEPLLRWHPSSHLKISGFFPLISVPREAFHSSPLVRPFGFKNEHADIRRPSFASEKKRRMSSDSRGRRGGKRRRFPGIDDTKSFREIFKNELVYGRSESISGVPREANTIIIGGGIIGCAAAFFLKEKVGQVEIMVVEKDPTYEANSAVLSAGGMRQQFSSRENIQMSAFGAQFLRGINRHLAIDHVDAPAIDVQFNHAGYLVLATKNQADQMLANYKVQREEGAWVKLLTESKLKAKFPWLNTEGIELATLGVEAEGWLDPYTLLLALKAKCSSMGVIFVKGKVVGFEHTNVGAFERLDQVLVELPSGDIQPVQGAMFINAAGAHAGEVARMAGIGKGDDYPLPVEPRKRYVYSFHAPEGPGLDCPLVTDEHGTYFRREGLGKMFISGASPPEELEPDIGNLDVDYEFFHEMMWPRLAYRVPAFNNIKLKRCWAGYYDYNFVDQNLIIGNHPYYTNMVLANGSSGHGMQHSLAIGRALSELLFDFKYRTIDLSRFAFERFTRDATSGKLIGLPAETNIY